MKKRIVSLLLTLVMVALDVFGMTGNDHDFEDADPLELAEIKRRWKPYIGQLPEYAYFCDELLSRSK